MIDIRFSVLGPGRVGRSLAHWLVDRGGRLSQVAARRQQAARELTAKLDGTAVEPGELSTAGEDLLLVTVTDGALARMATELATRPQAAVVLHASGSTDAAVLAPLRRHGSDVGSLHPLRAFPRPETEVERIAGTLFAIDGDEGATALAHRLVDAFDGRAVEIEPRARLLYHLAASLAAGGVVTVLSVARRIIERVGLPGEVEDGYYALARQALAEAAAAGHPVDALTGPAARGDADLVERQLAELEASAPELLPVVVALLDETRRARAERAPDPANWEALRRIFAKAKQRKSFLDPK